MSQTELLNISQDWSDNFLIVGILLVGEVMIPSLSTG